MRNVLRLVTDLLVDIALELADIRMTISAVHSRPIEGEVTDEVNREKLKIDGNRLAACDVVGRTRFGNICQCTECYSSVHSDKRKKNTNKIKK